MELTTKEKSRNTQVSLAVTVCAFVSLLALMAFKNMTFPALPLANETSDELYLSLNTGNDSHDPGNKTAATPGAKRGEEEQKAVAVPNGESAPVNNFTKLLETYRIAASKVSSTETIREEDMPPEVPGMAASDDNDVPGGKSANGRELGYSLYKRQLISRPRISNDTREEGRVIVEIVVDKDGSVIEANPNGRGTTTNNSVLKAKAKEIALLSRFSPTPGSAVQRGNIIINFSFK